MHFKMTVYSTIGRPVLEVVEQLTGFKLSLTLPATLLSELVKVCLLDVLHNGTKEQRAEVLSLCSEVVEAYSDEAKDG